MVQRQLINTTLHQTIKLTIQTSNIPLANKFKGITNGHLERGDEILKHLQMLHQATIGDNKVLLLFLQYGSEGMETKSTHMGCPLRNNGQTMAKLKIITRVQLKTIDAAGQYILISNKCNIGGDVYRFGLL